MENCLVTSLKGTVDNNSLKRFNRIRVRLSYPGDMLYCILYKGGDGGTAGEKISGTLFANSNRTTPITKELPVPSGNYRAITIYNGDQPGNPNHNTSVIDLVQDNIWAFCMMVNDVINISKARIYIWYSVDWEALCYSRTNHVNVSTMYLNESQNDVNVEDFFVKRFRMLRYIGDTTFEDATAKAYFPCVINAQPNVLDSQKRILFNKQPFFNRVLFMSTDINNDRFTLYDTVSNYVDGTGYNISNPVASYNNSTDEWTYNL